jgi:hypothetical protein
MSLLVVRIIHFHYQKYWYRMRTIRSDSSWTTFKIISIAVHIVMSISIIGSRVMSSSSSCWTAADNTLNYQQWFSRRSVVDIFLYMFLNACLSLPHLSLSDAHFLGTSHSPGATVARSPSAIGSRSRSPVARCRCPVAQPLCLRCRLPPVALLPSLAPTICRCLSLRCSALPLPSAAVSDLLHSTHWDNLLLICSKYFAVQVQYWWYDISALWNF